MPCRRTTWGKTCMCIQQLTDLQVQVYVDDMAPNHSIRTIPSTPFPKICKPVTLRIVWLAALSNWIGCLNSNQRNPKHRPVFRCVVVGLALPGTCVSRPPFWWG